jgi:hypothetical protein
MAPPLSHDDDRGRALDGDAPDALRVCRLGVPGMSSICSATK